MSEKKVRFSESDPVMSLDDKDIVSAGEKPISEAQNNSRFKAKHSLDSDEEDNPEEEALDDNDIEGQEDATIDYDQGIKITPFNMKDELEEGHFDKEGTFIFSKEDQIKDEWMDNINWVKIHQVTDDDQGTKRGYDDSSDDDAAPEPLDQVAIYRQMVELMKPKESVSKALRRLGGGKAGLISGSASQRLKAKKAKLMGESVDPEKEKEERENKENVIKLTGFADRLFQFGNLEVYQDTYEKLNFLIKTAEEKEAAGRTVIPDGTDADDALDMFADHMDSKDTAADGAEAGASTAPASHPPPSAPTPDSRTDPAPAPTTASTTKTKAAPVDLNDVRWEYKWENKEEAEVHGPFSSEEMAEWAEDDYFPNGVFVRKVGSTGPFYTSKRIDFELYT